MINKKLALAVLLGAALTGSAIGGLRANASDHDDGTTDVKSQNANLTDLYVFKENRVVGGSASNLVVILNCNPRSLPRQQYYFNQSAKYNVHFSYVGNNPRVDGLIDETVDNLAPPKSKDFTLTYNFGAPDSATGVQAMTVSAMRGTSALTASATVPTQQIKAEDLTVATNSATTTNITIDGQTVKAFAGPRQDPFFFDVERYFEVRDAAKRQALGTGTAVGFNNTTARDFTAGYNVLSIALSLPISVIAGTSGNDVFDVWETVEILSL